VAAEDAAIVEPPPAEPEPAPAEPLPPEPPAAEPSTAAEPPVADQTRTEPPREDAPAAGEHEPDANEALGDTEPHGFPAVEDEEEQVDVEDLAASEPEDDELDVLEDTPDFLQETPEHDRLWFEQKPPRDFDFD
jgi:hypothetical protein